MKRLLQAAAWLAAFSSFAANADVFNFSYTFNDDSIVTGSLSGELNGSLVQDISDVHVFLNGTEFSGLSLYQAAWNSNINNWDSALAPIVSIDPSQNNFIFADAAVPTGDGVTNYFYFANDPDVLGQQVFANNLNSGQFAFDSPANGTWAVTPAPVPLPAAYLLLTSGLGLLGSVSRRRKS